MPSIRPSEIRDQSLARRVVPKILAGVALATVVLLAGNLLILGASAWARATADDGADLDLPGIENFRVVDDQLWRGAAPSEAGYRALARRGVTTIIDLRAEEDIVVPDGLLAQLGLTRVAIPVRDGQIPAGEQVDSFLGAVATAPGRVFVHCGAGVGRAGTMVASYLVSTGRGDGWDAIHGNLAVGPPSLEQLAFAAGLDGAEVERPGALLVAVSRFLDAPRRLWARF